ncbi:hypothetical protein OAT16_06770 [Prolixibacteraceae bacterium]|nr:hypothetical protein [Prolixibacteraceae bacterium]
MEDHKENPITSGKKHSQDEGLKFANKVYHLAVKLIIVLLLLFILSVFKLIRVTQDIQMAMIGFILIQMIGLYYMGYLYNPKNRDRD